MRICQLYEPWAGREVAMVCLSCKPFFPFFSHSTIAHPHTTSPYSYLDPWPSCSSFLLVGFPLKTLPLLSVQVRNMEYV